MESLSMKICHGKSKILSVKALLRNIWPFFRISSDLPFITVENSSWWKKWLIILHINLLWLLVNILWWLLFLDIFWTSLPSMFTSPSFLSLFSSLPSLFLRFIVSLVLSRSFSSMLRNFPLFFLFFVLGESFGIVVFICLGACISFFGGVELMSLRCKKKKKSSW